MCGTGTRRSRPERPRDRRDLGARATGSNVSDGARRRRSTPEYQEGGWSLVLAVAATMIEVEHIEQVTDRRHVGRDIGIVGGHDRVRQIVAAAAGERIQSPISLDEFQDRSVVAVAVSDPAATGER